MRVCPNIGLDSWKELEKSVGKFRAYRLFISNNYEIPDIDSLEVSIESEDKVLDDIKDRLNKVSKILSDRVRDKTTRVAVDKLAIVQQQLETLKGLEGIQEYIKSASEIAIEYRSLMDDIISSKDLSRTDDLAFINKFLGVFDNLSELQHTMFSKESQIDLDKLEEWNKKRDIADSEGKLGQFEEENPKPINTTLVVDKTVKILEGIKKDYLNHGRILIGKRLWSTMDLEEIVRFKKLKKELLDKNPNDAYALSLSVTEKEFIEQLKQSSQDIDVFERWLTSAMGGSTNSLIALTAKLIKDSQMEVGDKLRIYEERLGEAYNKYIDSTGLDRNNPNIVNEPFIEKVKRIVNGEEIEVYQWIQERNYERWSLNLSTFYKNNEGLKVTNNTLFKKKEKEWFKANSQNKKDASTIIESKKAELTEYQFEEWSKKNIINLEARKFKGRELTEPGKYYESSKFKNMTEAQLEYFNILKSTFDEIKLLLPQEKQGQLGNMIPSVYKGDWEFALDGKEGLSKTLLDKVKVNSSDTQYELVDLNGRSHRSIPVHFTAPMDASVTSLDLLQSVLKAAKSWETAHSKVKIMSEIQLIQDIGDNLEVTKTNANNEGKVDPVSLAKNLLTKEGVKNIQSRLDEVIKDLYYGQEEDDTLFSIPLLGLKDLSKNKTTEKVLKATSLIGLAGNWISGSVNAIMGNLNNMIEAHSGEWTSKSSLLKGQKTYFKYMHHFIADKGKLVNKHWMTKVVEDFDLLHGDYINSFGDNVSGSRLKKELEVSNLLFLQTGAEHFIGISSGLSFLDSVKWIDGQWVNKVSFRESKGDMKKFDKAESLLDALEKNEGKLVGEQKNQWTIKDRQRLRDRVHEVSKYVHGNYAREDRTGLQRLWYGKLAIMFRKYVVPGMARRWGKKRFNHATGTVNEGFYRSTLGFFRNVFIEAKELGIKEAWSNNMTDLNKANLRRVVGEAVALNLVIALVIGLTPDDDEEKNTYWENVSLLLARRMQSEILFYVNPQDTWRILKTPAIAMNTVGDFAEFSGGLLFKYGEDEEYQRNTGIWNKGDSKDLARLVKLIPLLKGMLAGSAPEEQLKTFNR